MQKTRVLSIRIPLETLQSSFDLCKLLGVETSIAGTALSRSLTHLLANLRRQKKLPSYTTEELLQLTKSWTGKINPTSMPSLEICSFVDLQSSTQPIEESFQKPLEEPLQESSEESSVFDALSLEEEIIRQVEEMEIEDELDLLDKILIA